MVLHKHRIIPGHLGGTYDPDNVVYLNVEEHAEVHRLAYEKDGRWQDEVAWKALAGQIGKEDILYEISINAAKGRRHTEEAKEKIRLARLGSIQTEESNSKRRQKLKGIPKSLETRKRMSDQQKGKSHPHKGTPHREETKLKLSEMNKGKKLSPETIEKLKGRIPWNKGLKLKHAAI